MANTHHKALSAALEWHLGQGMDEALEDSPVDRTKIKPSAKISSLVAPSAKSLPKTETSAFLGKSDAYEEALKLANQANTLEELQDSLASFEGLAIRKTATNMVFCDGNPASDVMLVGEAPGADEDRLGRPFVGVSGQLLDRIFQCIGLDRTQEEPKKAVYISNILNWRPPGNRTPNPAEIEVSLPFIEKHIALIKPKILILCGGVSAKALLGRSEGISRLRKTWHDYVPQTKQLEAEISPISAIATYHPAYLLRTPGQKKAVWTDMLTVQEKLRSLRSD